MTPTEALDIIRQKVALPKGVSARIDPKQKNAVMVGTLDVVFAVSGPTLAHDEDYLLVKVNQSLKDLEKALVEHEATKAERSKAEALVKAQKDKLKRKR